MRNFAARAAILDAGEKVERFFRGQIAVAGVGEKSLYFAARTLGLRRAYIVVWAYIDKFAED